MATVSGVWKWNDPVYIGQGDVLSQSVNFTSNGTSYSSITVGFDFIGDKVELYDVYLEYDSTRLISVTHSYALDYFSSVPEQYELMDFGTTEQTVSDTFYTYLTANATQQAQTLYNVDPLTSEFSSDTGQETIYFNTSAEVMTLSASVLDNGELVLVGGEFTGLDTCLRYMDLGLIVSMIEQYVPNLPHSDFTGIYTLVCSTNDWFEGYIAAFYEPLYASEAFSVTADDLAFFAAFPYIDVSDLEPISQGAGWKAETATVSLSGGNTFYVGGPGAEAGTVSVLVDYVNTFASLAPWSETPPASAQTPDWANSFVKVGSTVTCEQCGGSGTYYWTETGILSEPCTSCGGSGMMGAEMCGACGGSGSMAVETVIEHNDPCPNCQATGFISTSENKAVEKVWIKQNGELVQIFGEQELQKTYAFQWNSSSSNWWNNYLHLVLNDTDYNKPPKTFPDLTSGVATPIKLWEEDDKSNTGQGRFALYDSSGQLITPIEFVGANCDSEGYFYLPSYLGEINGTITPPYYENGATVIFEYK